MNYIKISTEKDKELYKKFVQENKHGSLFQSLQWQKYQEKAFSLQSYLFVGKKEEKIVNSALVFQYALPFGKSYLYAPRGPLFSDDKTENDGLLQFIKDAAKEQNAIFFRFDPLISSKEKMENFLSLPMKQTTSVQPKTTLLVNLSQSEEDILKQMKQKGRYNIKIAEKKGVVIQQGSIDDLYPLLQETSKRDGFSIHSKKVYETMIETLENKALVFVALYEGKVIAGGIFVLYGQEMIYYYGASSNEYRNVMAPYLLQWEAMKYGKKQGATMYDFLGIAEEGVKNHPWAGVTEFKCKFGGMRKEYAGAWQITYSPFWAGVYGVYKGMR